MKNIALSIEPQFDVMAVRRDFPVLARMLRGQPLAYLGSGRTPSSRR